MVVTCPAIDEDRNTTITGPMDVNCKVKVVPLST